MIFFYLYINFFKNQTEKVSRFLMSGMWKLILDVEIEPAVKIEPGCGK